MNISSLKSRNFQKCLELYEQQQREQNRANLRAATKDENDLNRSIQRVCDESSLQAIKRQLEIHERLHNRYICGELSRNNMFCHHLEQMRETRKGLLKQLERMDVRMVPLPTDH